MKRPIIKIILPFSIACILIAGAVFMYSYWKQVQGRNVIFAMERVLDEIYPIEITESRLSAEAYHYAATGETHNLTAFSEHKTKLLNYVKNLESSPVNHLFDPEMSEVINETQLWISQLESIAAKPFYNDSAQLFQYLRSPYYTDLRTSVFDKYNQLAKNIITARENYLHRLNRLTTINMVGFIGLLVITILVLVFAYRLNAARIRQLYQLQIQQKEREFEVAFHHAPIGKVIVDRQGYCTRVNKSLCELLDYNEETLTKKRFADLTTPAEYQKDLNVISMLIQGNIKTHEREKQLINSHGDAIWVQQSMAFVSHEDGSPHQLIVQLKDITAEKESLRRLQDSNIELEQFAYTASHDLKEPLRMVDGFMKLLEKNYGDRLDETGRKYVHFATDGARRMNILLEDLLSYSRATRTSGEMETVDMNEMMNDICQLYQPMLEQKQATLSWDTLPSVSIQPAALRTVLQNLISNALKYQKENAAPQVSITAMEAGAFWKIVVADNGIGIRPEFFDKIFVIFKRLHGKTEYEGSGIGLATCKRLVEKWGGRIGVSSEEGVGSSFCFTIPKKSVS
ncbi:MAG: ATP-binding protein [Chitinophagaceae bacterium]|nr:ATP-binding protein [Chitinophagaceae bacterium]